MKKNKNTPDTDTVYNKNSVASSWECTGLTPVLPITDEEIISYEELGIASNTNADESKKT